MKYLFIVLFLSILTVNSTAQKNGYNFQINGSLLESSSGWIYLTMYKESGAIKDSSSVINGKFNFKQNIDKSGYAALSLPGKQQDAFVFLAEPVTMTIAGKGDTLKNLLISGSKLNDDDKKLKQQLSGISTWETKNNEMYKLAAKEKNQKLMDSLDEIDYIVMEAKRKIVGDYVKANPSALRSAMAIEENFGYYAEAIEIRPLYQSLSEKIKQTEPGKKIKMMLDVYETVAVGKKAPEIQQADSLGNLFRLSSLKGKYVLVDFWASWCGPCRRENPNIVKAYNQYHSKGFEILGVSYDNEKGRSKWLKAIQDDKLFWWQVSDLKGWNNATSALYYIKAIPSNVLIDKEGTIIAKNLFGKKLSDKLNELMP